MLSGELQWINHDDASADFLLGKEKLPARHPSGVQAVRPPAQPEGPAALAAGKYTQNYTQNCLTSRSHELPTHFLGGQPVAGSHIPNRLPSGSSSKIHRSGLRWPSLYSWLIFSSLNIRLNPALTLRFYSFFLIISKKVFAVTEPKPFIDVSIITRFNKHSTVMQFKSVFPCLMCVVVKFRSIRSCPKNANFPLFGARYFMALIQEMAVKIDQDFLAATLALFNPVTDTQADRQKVKASWCFGAFVHPNAGTRGRIFTVFRSQTQSAVQMFDTAAEFNMSCDYLELCLHNTLSIFLFSPVLT